MLDVICVSVRTAQYSTPALLTSTRLPLLHGTNWGSANGIMWVGSPHKWSPWWGAGSPSYPLTLFKASPFTVSQTAALRLHQLCCCAYRSYAEDAGWRNVDGNSICSKNYIYIHNFSCLLFKAVGFITLYFWGRQGGWRPWVTCIPRRSHGWVWLVWVCWYWTFSQYIFFIHLPLSLSSSL